MDIAPIVVGAHTASPGPNSPALSTISPFGPTRSPGVTAAGPAMAWKAWKRRIPEHLS